MTERAIDEIRREVRSQRSEPSTPSRQEEAQFFDISDNDREIPRPEDLPPQAGSLFPGVHLLSLVLHGSPPGCHAAPAEKASAVQSQTSNLTADDIFRRSKLLVDDGQKNHPENPDRMPQPRFYHASGYGTSASSGRAVDPKIPVPNAHVSASSVKLNSGMTSGSSPAPNVNPAVEQSVPDKRPVEESRRSFAPQPRLAPTFPCQISYDTRTAPSGNGPTRWYDAKLGRAGPGRSSVSRC